VDAPISARAEVEVREGRRGRGVFAARAFAAGEEIEVCPTVELPRHEAKGLLADYVFDSARSRRSVLLVLGYGMLYNHSEDPNVEYDQDDAGVVTFYAARDVAAGEELTITYGDEWWSGRGLEPVSESAG
jgi:SET domain-containing protein